MKKMLAGILACLMLGAACPVIPMQTENYSVTASAAAAMQPNPIISRGVPAYSGGGRASDSTDAVYYTSWQSSAPDYLAYDLSGVPASQRKKVLAVWYNDSTYDNLGE